MDKSCNTLYKKGCDKCDSFSLDYNPKTENPFYKMDAIYFKFDNRKYKGIVKRLFKLSSHSKDYYVSGTYDVNISKDDPLYSIIQFDNTFLIELVNALPCDNDTTSSDLKDKKDVKKVL